MLYLCEDFCYCSSDERITLQNQLKKISTGIVNLTNSLNIKQTR